MISDFEAILVRPEGNQLDFKATGYRLQEEEGRLALVKDVVSMANTPRDGESYIVTGVKKFANGSYELWGLPSHPDDADLQSLFIDRIFPTPTFRYEVILHEGKQFGVYVIEPVRSGPMAPMKDFGSLRQWQIYFRRESRNTSANPVDAEVIRSWFAVSGSTPHASFVDDTPGWEEFREATFSFDPSCRFVLILSPELHATIEVLKSLALVAWTLVLDFDPHSDLEGVLSAVKETLRERTSLNIATLRDAPSSSANATTEWCLPRGIDGRPETIVPGKWLDWKKAFGASLSQHINRVAALCVPSPVVVVVLWEDPSLIRYLQSTLEASVEAFGGAAKILIVSQNDDDYRQLAEEVDASTFRIPIEQLCRGLDQHFATLFKTPHDCVLPSSSGASMPLLPAEQRWLEEELELVTLPSGLVAEREGQPGVEFLRGNEPSWYDLGLHYDIDRDLTERLQQSIRRDLEGRRANRTNLYHAPGAGGTTLAKRLLWNFHRQFPCVRLRASEPKKTAERLLRLAALTGLPILVMIDGAAVTSRDMDELYSLLRSQQVPAILLQVLRRFSHEGTSSRTFFLSAELSDAEADRFSHIYSRERPLRKFAIENLARSSDRKLRSAFYFGLTAYQSDFKGLPHYVTEHLAGLSSVQSEVVIFIALAHYYAQKPMPPQAFAEALGLPANRPIFLQRLLDNASALLVQMEGGRWRTTHELVAAEILQQALWPTSGDRRLWKQHLSPWAIRFAQLCRGSEVTISAELLEIVRRTFFFRDNTDLIGTEKAGIKQFSQLIEDIPTKEGRLAVLTQVTELFPEEAHFWAHLGRYYGLEMRNHKSAGECVDRAIALEPTDPTLHHMRGMSLRYELYELIDDGGSLQEALLLAQAASQHFARARTFNPEDEHGYISEAQMLIRLANYAGERGKESAIKVLTAASTSVYLRESLQVTEDLLEIVRRNREGESPSPFETDCRAKLDVLYGNHETALQAWDSLLSRKDTYAPPVRRQIVWTLLARKSREWDSLASKDVDRIVGLLEANMLQEPDNEANLRLWMQAVKRTSLNTSLTSLIERVANWRVRSASLDANYYLYVLYALQAIESVPQASSAALRFIEECRTMAKYRRGRTKSYEWLGPGQGVKRLVHQSQLGEWNTETEFWTNTRPLVRIHGLVTRVDSPQAGSIQLTSGLTAFFVPARSTFSSRQVNERVQFFLGFSLDGLRAWDVKEA